MSAWTFWNATWQHRDHPKKMCQGATSLFVLASKDPKDFPNKRPSSAMSFSLFGKSIGMEISMVFDLGLALIPPRYLGIQVVNESTKT